MIEEYVQAISKSIKSFDADLNKAIEGIDEISADYSAATSILVEPLTADESYIEWINNNSLDWIELIYSRFGNKWGQLAAAIIKNGY